MATGIILQSMRAACAPKGLWVFVTSSQLLLRFDPDVSHVRSANGLSMLVASSFGLAKFTGTNLKVTKRIDGGDEGEEPRARPDRGEEPRARSRAACIPTQSQKRIPHIFFVLNYPRV